MKRLTLMRHADARWQDARLSDLERPLNRPEVPRITPSKPEFAIVQSRARSLSHEPFAKFPVRDHESLSISKCGSKIGGYHVVRQRSRSTENHALQPTH